VARRIAATPEADLHEVRLDLLRRIGDAAFDVIRRHGPRVIATCRRKVDGGGFVGDEAERLGMLQRAGEAGAAWIDIEADVLERDPGALASRGAARGLASVHDPAGGSDLVAIARRLSSVPADAVKIAVAVASADDLRALRRLRLELRDGRPAVLLGMGDAGLWTRVRPADFGSAWTYVAAADGLATAPGQPSLERALRLRVRESPDLEPIALLGGPQVATSPGPDVYNLLFARLGLPFQYLPLPAVTGREALDACRALDVVRASVTMPLKRALGGPPDVGSLDAWAAGAGSINTLAPDPVFFRRGWNTDAPAALSLLQECGALGGTVTVLGGGASGAAIAWAAASAGCRVAIAARDPASASLPEGAVVEAVPWERRAGTTPDAVVNCTPLGADGSTDPWDAPLPRRAVIDLAVLKGRDTPLVARARAAGLRVAGGLDFWCRQGATQASLLTGARIEEAAMRDALGELGWMPPVARRRPPATRQVRVPGSKSLTQRYLVLSALASSPSSLAGASEGQDSRDLSAALVELGALCARGGRGIVVAPRPFTRPAAPIAAGEGGTTARFVAALATATGFPFSLRLAGRIAERPMEALWEALRHAGTQVRVTSEAGGGSIVELYRTRYSREVRVDATLSSQFASALALVAPALPDGLRLTLVGEQVSRSYLDLTLSALATFGVRARRDGDVIEVPATRFAGRDLEVEGDWSLAAMWLAASRITGRAVRVANASEESVQGDRAFPRLLAELDARGDHRFDLRDVPDLLPPLAVASLFASSPTLFCGLKHARLKESDRLAVLAGELGKVRARVVQTPDGLAVDPAPLAGPARLDPRGDHRLAMAFGVLSLAVPGVEVLDPRCVSKSYPDFWQDLERVRVSRPSARGRR
jgi:3-phosphoshikimate 1-carboxyvinyltransferase